ncbi:uncharacterized protein LOC104430260 isoform X1 [Eucalyptus grandis]|uniref:Uncharacterized protein n=2 Tax=Eucalyptus grandis TaxID=71139 RepID=A0ACC3J0K9_EUCGR|nr:uncharacterized protein LOC104430260 isoform X1 [Eucalyptus grandis]KAK3407568.1 hypothetical protein EUGRSUZ_K03610 [Eucalyptus grandis]
MAVRYRRLWQISRFLPRVFAGYDYRRCTSAFCLSASASVSHSHLWERFDMPIDRSFFDMRRISTLSEVLNDSAREVENSILSFIQSSFNALEGPNHFWLNKVEADNDCLGRVKTFLVLLGQFDANSPSMRYQAVKTLRTMKSIKQRSPHVYVMIFQFGSSAGSSLYQTHLAELMIKEHVNFPVLFTSENFSEITNEPCFFLYKEFKNPVVFLEKDADVEMIEKAIEDFDKLDKEDSEPPVRSKSPLFKQNDIAKEPCLSSIVQNLLIYFPGCVTADEDGSRLFLSDSNHHRIIICDGSGKILDCIGSLPGFEDGDFESAKLFCPASSFYYAAEDCLYIADSENHAIRRADMRHRLVETIYPKDYSKTKVTVWSWIMNMLGLQRQIIADSGALDTQILVYPWHIMQLDADKLLIISRSFEASWILDLASGEIRGIVKGYQKILENGEELISERVALLKQIHYDWLQHQSLADVGEGLLYNDLISSITTLGKHTVLCDPVGHRVLKLDRSSGEVSTFKLSNFGVLGLPYWLALPLERFYTTADGFEGMPADLVQRFSLLPGRVHIKLNVDIPNDTELMERVQEGSIWRQARGAATILRESEEDVGSSEKVGVSQKWFDELDNLAFTVPEPELIVEDNNDASDMRIDDKNVRIDCAVNTSPGSSEVIVYAALYLRLRRNLNVLEDDREIYAGVLSDLLVPKSSGKRGRDLCREILLKSTTDLRELVFVKPLNVRIKFDTLNHPKADNSRDIILTESSIEVSASL